MVDRILPLSGFNIDEQTGEGAGHAAAAEEDNTGRAGQEHRDDREVGDSPAAEAAAESSSPAGEAVGVAHSRRMDPGDPTVPAPGGDAEAAGWESDGVG